MNFNGDFMGYVMEYECDIILYMESTTLKNCKIFKGVNHHNDSDFMRFKATKMATFHGILPSGNLLHSYGSHGP